MFMMMMRPMLFLSTTKKPNERTDAKIKQPIQVFFLPYLPTTLWIAIVPKMVKIEPELSNKVETNS